MTEGQGSISLECLSIAGPEAFDPLTGGTRPLDAGDRPDVDVLLACRSPTPYLPHRKAGFKSAKSGSLSLESAGADV